MIARDLAPLLRTVGGRYPVVTLTGPRQSGKTTLCREVFAEHRYVSLEARDVRDFARQDPRGFLHEHAEGAILDEIQHAPDLPGYLQEEVDARPDPGRFILTGSENFALTASVSQSLAGRSAVLHLLPLSLRELRRFDTAPADLEHTIVSGSYPRIHDRGIPADRWIADYVTTYVQRDVRQILEVENLEAFTTFLKHGAARTGCEVNLSQLGIDAGVTHNTARAWLSVLEASFLIFRLPAWHRSRRKQLVKAPKMHFVDSGLVCHLLGIHDAAQLRHHPLRGAIFESWVASEIYKDRLHRGLEPSMFHYRESKGLEVDLIVEGAHSLMLVESKSGATMQPAFLRPLDRLAEVLEGLGDALLTAKPVDKILAYAGDTGQRRSASEVLGWGQMDERDWS